MEIVIELEAEALVPTLEVFKQYFDTAYPCTEETLDGSNMSDEDLIKYATYQYFLDTYQKSKRYYDSAYNKLKNNLSEFEL